VIGRIVAQQLSQQLGHQLVVENYSGAGGNIGVPIALRAAPDGHTLLGISAAQTISPAIHAEQRYDIAKDVAPITQLTSGLYMLLVHPSLPVKSVKDLVALARAHPGKLLYGSAGTGQGTHLTAEMFRRAANIDITHVPYKGMVPATNDLVAGRISMVFQGIPSAQSFLKEGRLRALAVTSSKRSSLVPDLPTMEELGFKNFESTIWQGIVVHAGTPSAIVTRLNSEAVKAIRSPSIQSKLEMMGTDAVGSTPEAFAAHIKTEIQKWGDLIRDAKIRME
jgi:tripartite-type tricarboxylate transporter receptor subunit TctC